MTLEEPVPLLDGPDSAPLDAALALADIPLLPSEPPLRPSEEEESPWDVDAAELAWEAPLPDAADEEPPDRDDPPTLPEAEEDTWDEPATLDPPDAAREPHPLSSPHASR